MDLLACLAEAEVEYMLVGGYAVMAHGYIRATEDLDVWLRPSADNASRAMAALEEFGMPPGLTDYGRNYLMTLRAVRRHSGEKDS